MKDHTFALGFNYGRNVSRTRRVQLSAGAGPAYVDTIELSGQQPSRFWGPTGYGTATIDLGRESWTLEVRYRRAVSVLYGARAQAFFTDAATLRLGGLLNDVIEVVLSGGYSNGNTGGTRNALEPGRFDSFAFTSQVSVPLTDWWWAMASYAHYRYALSPVASLSLLLPPQLQRNAVYAGFTLRTPLP